VEHVFICQQVRHLRGFVLSVGLILLLNALVEVAPCVSHASRIVADGKRKSADPLDESLFIAMLFEQLVSIDRWF